MKPPDGTCPLRNVPVPPWSAAGAVAQAPPPESGAKVAEIDWEPADPEIHLEIYDQARLFVHHVVRLSELQPALGNRSR